MNPGARFVPLKLDFLAWFISLMLMALFPNQSQSKCSINLAFEWKWRWHLLNRGPRTSYYCHQHISSPTSITNIDITQSTTIKDTFKGTSQIAGRKSCQEEEEDLIWFLVPVGLRVVAIQHEKTGFYIAMNSDAKIFASVRTSILISTWQCQVQ